MAHLKKLLEPGYIGNIRIKNRASIAPAEKCINNEDGSVNQKFIDYMVERAKNGVGMIFVEHTYVDPVGRSHHNQLGIYDDKLIPGHKQLTDAVHKYGTAIGCQIDHAGRQTTPLYNNGRQPVSASPVPCDLIGSGLPRELTVSEIKEVVDKFGEAADRVKKAGYDMITVHAGHGYLPCAFISPYTNLRSDEYGGTLENRMRFSLEILAAIRKRVSDNFPVGFRISADEFVDGGLTLDETTIIAKKLEEAGVDYLDVSAGSYDARTITVGYMDMPIGHLVYLAAAIKEVVKVPIITVGRINDMVFAESVLENNQADFVHMIRAFHADPEILVKSEQGRMDEVCMCIACNKCVDMMRLHQPTFCAVNPAALREREFELKPAKQKKKVMVIGGGIAGMEAARIARIRGHDVTLFEKDEELGGQVRWAAKTKYRVEFSEIIRYRIHEIKRTGVKLELGREITLSDVSKCDPDVVIVATGAVPIMLPIPGVENPMVVTCCDLLSGKSKIGKKSIAIGGGKEGLTAAEFLTENGGKVIIVEPAEALGLDLGSSAQRSILGRLEENQLIEVRLKTTVENIEGNEITLQCNGGFETITGVDSVIMCWNKTSVNRLADEIIARGKVSEVYCIGDAAKPREMTDAIYEGAVTGRRI